jgi:UDP-N-acetylglucosamine 1-carboxyvinyltransferase
VEKLLINGGKPLVGQVAVSGAKNATVALIPAACLLMINVLWRICP